MARYSVNLQWSKEDNVYIATNPELPELNAFGATAEEALKELSIAQELYLEVMEEDGEDIPEPNVYKSFSGQTRIRLPKGLHEGLSNEAVREGVSLNTYMVQLLSERNAFQKVKNALSEMENTVYTCFTQSYPDRLTDAKVESGRAYLHVVNGKSTEEEASYAVG